MTKGKDSRTNTISIPMAMASDFDQKKLKRL